ncbi:MAG: hypothetical protein ACQES8_09175 [Thermodesulfobacteriota bacterium]
MRIYKSTWFYKIFLLGLFFSLFTHTVRLEASQPLYLSGPRIKVIDLRADFHSDNTIIVVSGKIKNVSHEPMRGYVNIYLLNSSGHTITAYAEPVNSTRSFGHGEIVDFETVINVADIKGINNISVEFVRQ